MSGCREEQSPAGTKRSSNTARSCCTDIKTPLRAPSVIYKPQAWNQEESTTEYELISNKLKPQIDVVCPNISLLPEAEWTSGSGANGS